MTVSSYSEIFHVAHKAVEEMWTEPVEIQEKVDGSQISWWVNPDNGELEIRSKGRQLHEGDPSASMFKEAIESLKKRKPLLVPGQIWRGEYLQKAKHNTIRYERVPEGHIIVFDLQLGLGNYAQSNIRQEAAGFIGLEVVPTYYNGIWGKDLADLKHFLGVTSILGGSAIEGVVIKCYTKFYGGKPMMAKLVSDEFKETHEKEWKKNNPSKKDIIEQLIDVYRTETRWKKAVQHLRDNGQLTNSPQDIGPLLKEISSDIKKEEEDAIKEALFKLSWPQISRGVTRGFPDWYKEYLLEDKNG